MKIKKILNNNLVIASDRDNEEVVVWSKGLGFRKKKETFFRKKKRKKSSYCRTKMSKTSTASLWRMLIHEV